MLFLGNYNAFLCKCILTMKCFFPALLPAQKDFCIPPLDAWQTAAVSFCQSLLGQAYPSSRQGRLSRAVGRTPWFYSSGVIKYSISNAHDTVQWMILIVLLTSLHSTMEPSACCSHVIANEVELRLFVEGCVIIRQGSR